MNNDSYERFGMGAVEYLLNKYGPRMIKAGGGGLTMQQGRAPALTEFEESRAIELSARMNVSEIARELGTTHRIVFRFLTKRGIVPIKGGATRKNRTV